LGGARKLGTAEDARRVYDAWLARQKRPGTCRYTAERESLLRRRLGLGYSADDLVALVRYMFEADRPTPRWFRGENPQRTQYLDLDNLLREEKLGGRVTEALTWAADLAGEPTAVTPAAQAPLTLIQGGRFRR
jgi:hypothetical protein